MMPALRLPLLITPQQRVTVLPKVGGMNRRSEIKGPHSTSTKVEDLKNGWEEMKKFFLILFSNNN